jgi:non-ribosomal peptide synthetase component F
MGFIHPECSVEVRDDQGGKLPPGQSGEITVSSECLSPGYWKRAELNAAKYVVGEDQKRHIAPLAEAKSINSWRRSYRPTKFPRVSFFSNPFPLRIRTR